MTQVFHRILICRTVQRDAIMPERWFVTLARTAQKLG